MKRYACVVSLGCSKNLVDSEAMIPQLTQLGYALSADPHEASLLLINTCGFLESAVEEAIEAILEMAGHKTSGACEQLVVTGCMVQRYGKKLLSLLPEVDLFLGTSHVQELGTILASRARGNPQRLWIASPRHLFTSAAPRARSTNPWSAYLKIAEGCSNQCSFCLIPHLRGPYRSRSIGDILQEASRMAREGVKEINLIAQDLTAFGSDRSDPKGLPALLESLEDVEGLAWLRLFYVYPDRVSEALLRTMARSRKVLPYLDIPLQHCVPKILRAMRRESPAGMDMDHVIAMIRQYLPDVALRTSLMVGFPGETEEDFQQLLRFVERTRFDHVGVFAFSPEAGTRAARLADPVAEETRERRRRELHDLQREISRNRLKLLVGRTLPVLVEGPHPETDLLLAGRLPTQAPEVDGTVLITRGTAESGEIRQARITAAHDYDLEAELLEEAADPPASPAA